MRLFKVVLNIPRSQFNFAVKVSNFFHFMQLNLHRIKYTVLEIQFRPMNYTLVAGICKRQTAQAVAYNAVYYNSKIQ